MSTQNFATLQMVRNILDGTTIPARATADGEGNNIPDTYAKKGGKIIPVGIYPPSSTGTTLVLGTYDGEVSVGDVALIMQLSGTTDWGGYNPGDLYEITAVNSNAVTLASSAIGNILTYAAKKQGRIFFASVTTASGSSTASGSVLPTSGTPLDPTTDDFALIVQSSVENTNNTSYPTIGEVYKISSVSGTSVSYGARVCSIFGFGLELLPRNVSLISSRVAEFPLTLAISGSFADTNFIQFTAAGSGKKFALLTLRASINSVTLGADNVIGMHNMTLHRTHRMICTVDYNNSGGRVVAGFDFVPEGDVRIYFDTGDNTNSGSWVVNGIYMEIGWITLDEGESF